MPPTSPNTDDDQNHESDERNDAMKDQLRKDVASWSASRSEETRELTTKQNHAPAAARAPRQKAKPAKVVAAPVATEKKPFKMSYDGMTDRDFMAHRVRLGAR